MNGFRIAPARQFALLATLLACACTQAPLPQEVGAPLREFQLGKRYGGLCTRVPVSATLGVEPAPGIDSDGGRLVMEGARIDYRVGPGAGIQTDRQRGRKTALSNLRADHPGIHQWDEPGLHGIVVPHMHYGRRTFSVWYLFDEGDARSLRLARRLAANTHRCPRPAAPVVLALRMKDEAQLELVVTNYTEDHLLVPDEPVNGVPYISMPSVSVLALDSHGHPLKKCRTGLASQAKGHDVLVRDGRTASIPVSLSVLRQTYCQSNLFAMAVYGATSKDGRVIAKVSSNTVGIYAGH